jgi:AAA+ ATPase superfamily predicted ATPase
VATYRWPAVGEFRNRSAELAKLDHWWSSDAREPMNLYGRRRVGKSWLFRKFAHGKPAVILVADRMVAGQQLTYMSAQLEPVLGFRPQLNGVADLFGVLYELAGRRKTLVVIDEFPYLLGTTASEQQRNLATVQAVIEQKRESSKLKLVLTGSTIAQMETLQAERSPLHGRLVPLRLLPLSFAEATLLLDPEDLLPQLTRYSVAGGMPRYLDALGRGPLAQAVADVVADRHGPLFNEPRTLLQTELREPAVYFSVLTQLARNPQHATSIAATLRMENKEVSRYLGTLETLRLVARRRPAGGALVSRNSQWGCSDHFVRFWFRFIQPFQGELEAGADPLEHVKLNILPHLADHTAPVFEEVVTSWMRTRHAGAHAVGAWWGPALNHLRVRKERFTEEIDTIVIRGKQVTAVAEAKWTTKSMDASVLTDLVDYKIPALGQAGFNTTGVEIVLASKSGFTAGLRKLAAESSSVTLVDAASVLSDLIARPGTTSG